MEFSAILLSLLNFQNLLMEGSEGSFHLFVSAEAAGDPVSLLRFPLIDCDLAETGEKLSRSDHFPVSYEPKLHDSSGKRRTIPVYKGIVSQSSSSAICNEGRLQRT